MIDDYGAGLYPDLLFHYGVNLVDVVQGNGPAPALVIALIQRLPDTSMTSALASGGKAHFGWGIDRHMTADLFDALQANTAATGNWKKGRTPDLPQWPRPKARKEKPAEPRRPVSVAEIYQRYQR